jgi:hypothetical protein
MSVKKQDKKEKIQESLVKVEEKKLQTILDNLSEEEEPLEPQQSDIPEKQYQ